MKIPLLVVLAFTVAPALVSCDAQTPKPAEPSAPKQPLAGEQLPASPGVQLPAPKTPTEACVQSLWITEAKANIPAFVQAQTAFLEELEKHHPRLRDDELAKNFKRVSQFVDGSRLLVKTLTEGYGKIVYDKVDTKVAQATKEYCDRTIAVATALHKYWLLKQDVVNANRWTPKSGHG